MAKADRQSFFVEAHWDDEAKRFYSSSNITGLHIETETIEAFEDVMFDAAVDLIIANHLDQRDLDEKPLRDLIPGIFWQRPAGPVSATG